MRGGYDIISNCYRTIATKIVPLSSLQIEFEFSIYFTVKCYFLYQIRKLSFDMDLSLCFYQ